MVGTVVLPEAFDQLSSVFGVVASPVAGVEAISGGGLGGGERFGADGNGHGRAGSGAVRMKAHRAVAKRSVVLPEPRGCLDGVVGSDGRRGAPARSVASGRGDLLVA